MNADPLEQDGSGRVDPGPSRDVVLLSYPLDVGLRAPLYAIALFTSGVASWPTALILAVWAGCAAQVAALVAGRYAPLGSSSRR